jgi:hypothetical protein
MDFGDIALVALLGGGIYYYINMPEEAFTDTDKFPVVNNPDGTKSQTRTKDDGSKIEVFMKTNQYFRKTATPKPGADGKVAVSDIIITFYDDEGKSISAEKWTNDTVLASSALAGLQTAGGFVGNGGNSSSGPATTLPTPQTQVPRPPSTFPNSFPPIPGGFMPPPQPPPVATSTQPQEEAPPNPGYIQPSGFPVPGCVSSPFGVFPGLPRPPQCATSR